MIERVSVHRFQSLWDAEVELGGLTVIVGPSNSGKSAFGRALRSVARNTTGHSQVSLGAKIATVSLRDGEQEVVLERGKGSSTYRISDEVYAKCGSSVPEEVAKVLALPEGDPDVHFADQFSGPFLLNATPTTASRVLGELTNVTLLSEAAREANRRRAECMREAGFVQTEIDRDMASVEERYRDLPDRKRAVITARELVNHAEHLTNRAVELERVANQVITASIAAEKVQAEAKALKKVVRGMVKQMEGAEKKARRGKLLSELVEIRKKAVLVSGTARVEAQYAVTKIKELEHSLSEVLSEAGNCPVCGAVTK